MKIFLALLSLSILFSKAAWASVESSIETKVEAEGGGTAEIRIENNVESSSDSEIKIERRVETNINGETQIYESNSPGKETVTVKGGKLEVTKSPPEPTEPVTSPPEENNRDKNWIDRLKEEIREWLESLTELIDSPDTTKSGDS